MNRHVIEARAKALLRKRERQAAELTLHKILNIMNFRLPRHSKVRRERLYGDPKTGMEYETLYECLQELGGLMDSWLAAGCRLDKWPKPIRQQLENDLNRRRISLYSDRNQDGRASYNFTPPIREEIDSGLGECDGKRFSFDPVPGRTEATKLFFQFITGPFQREVGQCKRCRVYFWNQWGHSNKLYCNARCASADTAARVTSERRRKERQDNLAAVQRAIKRFEQLSAEKRSRYGRNWKRWVKGEAGSEISLNFITRAINTGELRTPLSSAGTEKGRKSE
jgi:hypothetical protein